MPMDDQNRNIPIDENNSGYEQYISPKKSNLKRNIILALCAFTIFLLIILALAVVLSQKKDADKSSNSQTAETQCTDENCLNSNFYQCLPAYYETTDEAGSKLGYKVLGIKDAGCDVNIKYLASSDDNLVNKEMVCDLDNEIDFMKSLELANTYPADYECQGTLIDYRNFINENGKPVGEL